MEVCQNFSDGSCAFKGKRTKRSRLLFPVDTTGTTSSSTTGVGSDDDGDDFYNSTIQYSPTTSTTQISTTNTSEEDEDMANCLILLAQSGRRKVQVVTESKKDKISSRTFAETAISTTGKSGFYVYECKTCNRTFSSFQALGGHRASHKKPKSLLEEKKSVNNQEQGGLNKISLSLSNQIVKSKTKIHECSICGSNFSSGQALGGHMRRHRLPTTTTPATNTEILMNFERTSNVSESSSTHDDKSSRNIISLDLNLPAPPEDDHNFEQSLVFSATPLVDCYY